MEETPITLHRFNGDISTYKKNKSESEIYKDYFRLNPSFIDNHFTGLEKSTIECVHKKCNY